MAKHNVDILIRARDRASKQMRKTAAATRRTSSAMRGLKAAVAGIGVYGLIRGVRSVVEAYGEQEAAETALRSALASTGQEVEKNQAMFEAYAGTLQGVTVYGDEFLLRLMAQATNLGITAENLEETTRQAIGLSTALRMDLNTALRYVSLATQGEFTMLRRYIPELRQTTDATEQLAIVNRVAAAGFVQARAEAETTQGRIKQLSNAWGDFKEAIGQAVASGGQMTDWLGTVTFWLRNVDLGWDVVVNKVKLSIAWIWNEIRYTFVERIPNVLVWLYENWVAVWRDIGNATVTILKGTGANIGEFFSEVGDVLTGGDWDPDWHDLLGGFESTIAEWPELMRDTMSEVERELWREHQRLQMELNRRVRVSMFPGSGGGGGGPSNAAGGGGGPAGGGGAAGTGAFSVSGTQSVEARFLTGLKVGYDMQRQQVAQLREINGQIKRQTQATIDMQRAIEDAQLGKADLVAYNLGA
jgi:hypothetical protein